MRRLFVVCLVLVSLLASGLAQEKGTPAWCEVEVDLGKNGRSRITYTVMYRIQRRDFHGFYFHGPQISALAPVWDDGWGRATHSSGRE